MDQPAIEPAAEAPNDGANPTPTMPTPANVLQKAAPSPTKPIHSLVIDANAIIKNDPTVSTLLAQAQELYTIPAVVSESTISRCHSSWTSH